MTSKKTTAEVNEVVTAEGKKDDRKIYLVLVECWINGERVLPGQKLKLTDIQAKEWLERKYIKISQ